MRDDVKRAIDHLQDKPQEASLRSKEKRVYPRFRVSFSVHIRLSGGDLARASATNLSQGGIYIEYGASADEGREFDMLFDLPFEDAFRRVYVRARVVRSVVIGDRDLFGIAFTFLNFAKDTDQVLEKYLELRAQKQH